MRNRPLLTQTIKIKLAPSIQTLQLPFDVITKMRPDATGKDCIIFLHADWLCSSHEFASAPASEEGWEQQEENEEGGRGRMAGVVATDGRSRNYLCDGKDG